MLLLLSVRMIFSVFNVLEIGYWVNRSETCDQPLSVRIFRVVISSLVFLLTSQRMLDRAAHTHTQSSDAFPPTSRTFPLNYLPALIPD